MLTKVIDEQPFQVLTDSFSISPSTTGYELEISADGINFSPLFAVAANTTRLVTNVANGSYYRLKNNSGEVVVNWRTTCKSSGGGGGGSYVLPAATTNTLGGVKIGSGITVQPDGTISAEGGGVLVVDSLSSSEAANAPVGSLVGQYKKEGTYLETMPVDSPDVKAEKIVIKGDVDFSNARLQMFLFNGNFYFEFGRSDGKWTKINKGNVNGNWTLDGVDIGGSWTGETDGDVLQIAEGSNWSVTFTKQANGDWIGEIWGGTDPHFKYITNLTGSNAFRYEAISPIEANLYMKVSGGTVAHWQGYRTSNQTEPFEIIYDDLYDFTTFCDGKIMFSLRYQYGGGTRYAFMDAANQAIVYYSDSAKTTEVARVNYLGAPAQFGAESWPTSNYTWVEWKEDAVYFYGKNSNTIIEDLIDFHTEGVHFVRITDPTKATASDLGLGDNTTNGIPIWNNEGVIVGKTVGYSTKDIQFNTNASKYSNTGKVTFITNGTNNGPERIFVPTEGGTSGQILISQGDNAAPSFTNWIKSVKISSDDYEALATKDPNTLYLIVDE